jgi:hypothetical protein
VSKKTPPSFYDTLELGEVKKNLVWSRRFLPVFTIERHKNSNFGLLYLLDGPQPA